MYVKHSSKYKLRHLNLLLLKRKQTHIKKTVLTNKNNNTSHCIKNHAKIEPIHLFITNQFNNNCMLGQCLYGN